MSIPFKKESHRKERVAGLIKQEVSKIILHELKDPRTGFCTVTKVEVSGDLKNAIIYVSILGEESEQRTTMRGLNHARSFIQRRLFQELKLRHPPVISFELDQSIEKSIRIARILHEEGVNGSDTPQDINEQSNESTPDESEETNTDIEETA